MKECRWNVRRFVWAFFVILCYHGNFADDPAPAMLQPEHLFHITQAKDQNTVRDTPEIASAVLPESAMQSPGKVTLTNDEQILVSVLSEDAVDANEPLNSLLSSVVQDEPVTSLITDSDSVVLETVTSQQSVVEEPVESQSMSGPLGVDIVNRIPLPEKITNVAEDSWSLQKDVGETEAPASHLVLAKTMNTDGETGNPEKVVEPTSNELPSAAVATGDSEEATKATMETLIRPDRKEVEKGTPVQEPDAVPDPPVVDSGTPPTEDMPSFNEWTKKRLEEQVKHGQHPQLVASQQGKVSTKQMRHKNYASIDCGAKVISANPEAQSTAAVLTHYRDDYMLNPCTAKIWLIIELCEAIQADRIDLANYELFSSSPREFSVYSSDRYPPRDWTFLGTFEAKDERSVQNFTIDHSTFGKYIKVEMGSHYGSEHFCPLSLVRVFGTSEYEALETEDRAEENIDDSLRVNDVLEEDDLLNEHMSSQESKNLFGSATDAVINIVKKAAEVLRSENVEEVVKPKAPQEKFSITSSDQQLLKKPNCLCLQRLPPADCEQNSAVTNTNNKCSKHASVDQLQCSYSELHHFLTNVWSRRFRGILSKKCSSSCKPFLMNCDDNSFIKVVSSHGACRFFRAAFGSLRFGALCHLDKLLLDEQRKVPIVKPHCQYPNETGANVSLPKVDFIHPQSTPPIVVEGTASHAVYEKSSPLCDGGYVCTSGDQLDTCLTQSNMAPLPISDSCRLESAKSVIKTEIISESGDIIGTVVDDALRKSQISPTKTLPDDVKLSVDSNVLHHNNLDRVVSVGDGDRPDAGLRAASVSFSIRAGKASLSGETTIPVISEGQPSKKQKSEAVAEEGSGSLTVSNGSINTVPEERVATFIQESEHLPESVLVVPSMSSAGPVQVDTLDRSFNGDHFIASGGLFSMDTSADSFLDSESVTLEDEGGIDVDSKGSVLVTTATLRSSKMGNGQSGALVPNQKESVFVRLSNRIKALELNMSLSGQYLEELSRRYRKQMEEMQKAFNKTISALNETARKAYERDMRQQELIRTLQAHLENVSRVVLNLEQQQENLHVEVVSRHVVLMIIEVLIISALFLACSRTSHQQHSQMDRTVSLVHPTKSQRRSGSLSTPKCESQNNDSPKRRNSDSSVGSLRTKQSLISNGGRSQSLQDKHRTSTETLNVSGTYSDPLLTESSVPVWVNRPSPKDIDHPKKKKRQRNKAQGQGKTQLYRSVSSNVLPSNCGQKPPKVQLSRKSSTTNVSSAGLLFASTDSSRSRVQDFVPSKRNGYMDHTPSVHTPVERISMVATLPKHFLPNQWNGSVQYPSLSNLVCNGVYPPELISKSIPRKAESSFGYHTLNNRLQQLPPPPPRDHLTLKKVTEKVC